MNTRQEKTPSAQGQQLLGILRQAVGKALVKKRRLGQYAVIWKDGKPVVTGEGEPCTNVSAPDGLGAASKEDAASLRSGLKP